MPSGRYKKAADLYVRGTEVVIGDDAVVWLQALNPFEYEDVRSAAQNVRARYVMAMEDVGSDEYAKYQSYLRETPRPELVDNLVNARSGDAVVKVLEALEEDPEWKDIHNLLASSENEEAVGPTQEELEAIANANRKYLQEADRRLSEEHEALREEIDRLDEESMREELRKLWVETKATERATSEFSAQELATAARDCKATFDEDEQAWKHDECDHSQRIWTPSEVRSLPDELLAELHDGMSKVNVAVRQAKGSGRAASSSGSSPLPAEPEASQPSSPEPTSEAAPGTST